MQLKLFTVFDSQAEAYLPPFYMKTKGEAIRAILETLKNPEHNFSKYPDDFTLFELGSWDDANCKYDLLKTPYSLGVLKEFMKPSAPVST